MFQQNNSWKRWKFFYTQDIVIFEAHKGRIVMLLDEMVMKMMLSNFDLWGENVVMDVGTSEVFLFICNLVKQIIELHISSQLKLMEF